MNIIDAILTKADPVEFIGEYTELKRWSNTGEYRGQCPIHGGDNPTSLMVKNGSFYCHSCGHGGSIINFIQYLDDVTYDEAVYRVAEKLNLDIKQDEDYMKQRSAVESNIKITQRHMRKVDDITPYLVKRGLTEETIEKFKLGWSDLDKALVIPIEDYHGRIVAFSKRFFDQEPKYRNSKNNDLYDKGKLLYNAHRAKKMLKDNPYLYVVEGYIDCMSADQQNLPCVAYCGSELTKDHVILIRDMVQNNPNITIVLCPDNDEVGRSKIPKMREKFSQNAPKVNVRVGQIPTKVYNEDIIDEWNTEGWVDGIKDFNDLLLNNYNIVDIPTDNIDIYTLTLILDGCPDINAQYILAEEFVKSVKNDMVKSDIARMLAPKWGKTEDEVKQYLKVSYDSIEDKLGDFKMADRCIKEYHDMIQHEGLGFGFATLDASLRGARPGDVVFFGGYSGVGKTFFCVEFTLNWAVRKKKNVLFISLEMPAAALYERIIANIMGISTQEVEQLAKSNDPYSMYSQVKEKVQKYIVVIDKNNLSVKDIDQYVQIANARIWENGRTDVVIIDYLQYMAGTNNFEELSATAKGLKPLAKDNNMIVVCLSQLNRSGSAWEKPSMKLLKGSGDIESTGDIILLAWRPSEDPALTALEKQKLEGTIMLTIGKARRGVLGATDFELFFHKEQTRIREKSPIAA